MIALLLEYLRNDPRPKSEAEATDESVGPFRNAEVALSVLTTNLAIAFNPDAIFLFGSRACGTERPDSDFDLMVVTPDDQPLDYLSVRKPISGCGCTGGCRSLPVFCVREESESALACSLTRLTGRENCLMRALTVHSGNAIARYSLFDDLSARLGDS